MWLRREVFSDVDMAVFIKSKVFMRHIDDGEDQLRDLGVSVEETTEMYTEECLMRVANGEPYSDITLIIDDQEEMHLKIQYNNETSCCLQCTIEQMEAVLTKAGHTVI